MVSVMSKQKDVTVKMEIDLNESLPAEVFFQHGTRFLQGVACTSRTALTNASGSIWCDGYGENNKFLHAIPCFHQAVGFLGFRMPLEYVHARKPVFASFNKTILDTSETPSISNSLSLSLFLSFRKDFASLGKKIT